MTDYRIDLVEGLREQKLVRSKYTAYSAEWKHDHCAACGATFSEIEGYGFLHEGYTTGPAFSKGSKYEWICMQCFDELKGEMNWSAD